jgi:hypothetical protein
VLRSAAPRNGAAAFLSGARERARLLPEGLRRATEPPRFSLAPESGRDCFLRGCAAQRSRPCPPRFSLAPESGRDCFLRPWPLLFTLPTVTAAGVAASPRPTSKGELH